MESFIENTDGILVPASLLVPNRAAVYCDESGNSGPNYIDPPQPFYVLAGWLVPDDRLVEVSVAIDGFRRRHFRQRDELKSAAVLRDDHTKRKCIELFGELGKLHCVPLYLVAEKRFCVAGKIVETFLDPLYHKFLTNSFTMDVETKQEIANTLYETLPQQVVEQFAAAYRNPTAEGLAHALRSVMTSVEANVSPELAKAIAGSETFIDEIARVEADTSPLGNVAGTLNMPCLVSFLMLVENLGRLGVARPIKLFHDQQHAYEEGYKRIFEIHKGMPRFFARLPHTDLSFSSLEHVAEFGMKESKTTMPIQAADLLAGTIHHLFRLALRGDTPTPGDLALAKAVLPGLLMSDPRLTWLVCSEQCMKSLGRSVFRPAIHEKGSYSDKDPANAPLIESAPVFPVRNSTGNSKDGVKRARIDLPLFGLVGTNDGALMVINNPESTDEHTRRYLPLFTSRRRAKKILDIWEPHELNQPQLIVSFGPKELPDLLDLLDHSSELTDYIALDPGTPGPLQLLVLPGFVAELRRMLSRSVRTFQSGMHHVLLEKHMFGKKKVLSMQLKGGQYGAMILPKGKIYVGATRDEAVSQLRSAEGL